MLKKFLCASALLVTSVYGADLLPQDQFKQVLDASQEKDWSALVEVSKAFTKSHPDSLFYYDAIYYLGVGYFGKEEYELANHYFTKYQEQEAAKFFLESIEYKFKIAQAFADGAKKHLFGWDKMPRWISAREDALEIFEEVIATVPRHNLAAESLFYKAELLRAFGDFDESLSAYNTLIRRFQKNALTPECYLGIARVYLKRCDEEFADPNFLARAEINLRKFRDHFPTEPRLASAEELLGGIKEKLASEMYEIGQFYERTKKEKAAMIYYSKTLKKYPATPSAEKSQNRLSILKAKNKTSDS